MYNFTRFEKDSYHFLLYWFSYSLGFILKGRYKAYSNKHCFNRLSAHHSSTAMPRHQSHKSLNDNKSNNLEKLEIKTRYSTFATQGRYKAYSNISLYILFVISRKEGSKGCFKQSATLGMSVLLVQCAPLHQQQWKLSIPRYSNPGWNKNRGL